MRVALSCEGLACVRLALETAAARRQQGRKTRGSEVYDETLTSPNLAEKIYASTGGHLVHYSLKNFSIDLLRRISSSGVVGVSAYYFVRLSFRARLVYCDTICNPKYPDIP